MPKPARKMAREVVVAHREGERKEEEALAQVPFVPVRVAQNM